MSLAKIPTTIITGFLGSGKTTLLRHLLQHAQGRRYAIIVNEFGELGIDGEILKTCTLGCDAEGNPSPAAEQAGVQQGPIYELSNGCLCCTVQEEFFPVMQQLVERRTQLDHILIETSGLALPKPLIKAFQWPTIKNACTVDAVITVVDTPATAAGQFAAPPSAIAPPGLADPNLDHDSPLHELFEDQLAAADLVVLNKTDLLSEADCQAVEALVRAEIPPHVKVLRAQHGQVPPPILLGQGCAAEETIDQRPDHHSGPVTETGQPLHDHDHHDHEAFDSVVVELPATEPQPLLEALRTLVATHPIYRAKGFVAVPNKPMRLVVQGVGQRFESHFDRRWRADEPRRSVIVLIGQGLDAKALPHTLRDLLLEVPPSHLPPAGGGGRGDFFGQMTPDTP